jgi:hypothetical protein
MQKCGMMIFFSNERALGKIEDFSRCDHVICLLQIGARAPADI